MSNNQDEIEKAESLARARREAEEERIRLGLPDPFANFGGSKDVSPDPALNCCKCGYFKQRNGICWTIDRSQQYCKVCGSSLCRFCNVGMHPYKDSDCKRRHCLSWFLKPFIFIGNMCKTV